MKHGNREPRQVLEKIWGVSQKANDRMGKAYVKTDMEKGEVFDEGD
jgi:hypothetical protein